MPMVQRKTMDDNDPRTPLARSGLLVNDDQSITSAQKFDLIKGELMTNPARSDGLIAYTIGKVSKASVYRVREVLVAERTIPNIPVCERVSATGEMARQNASHNHWNGNGNRIKTGNGKLVSDLCREALEAEDNGISPDDAARIIGIGRQSYREGKIIVMLADRNDLPPADKAVAVAALEEMNNTRRTGIAYKKIRAIVERHFGVKRRRTQSHTEKNIGRRNERFQNTMTVLFETCASASGIPIPPSLSKEEIADAVRKIEESRRAMRTLRERIQQGRQR